MVLENLGLCLGNGNSISFWKDKWVPSSGRLLDHATSKVSGQLIDEKVSDMLINPSRWNWEFLSSMLHSHICAKIAVVPPSPGLFDGDVLVWLPSSNGNFSVKSAYTSISHMDGAISDPLYKLI